MSYEMHFIGEKIKDTQFTLEKLIFGNKWLLDIKKNYMLQIYIFNVLRSCLWSKLFTLKVDHKFCCWRLVISKSVAFLNIYLA